MLNKHKQIFILFFFIIIYISYFTLASFLRYDNFYTGRFDLGNMDQTVWNTIHGRIFETSNVKGEVISRLSAHADFLLVLLSPFYLIWEHPKMLLLIQTVILSAGAFFVYAIAKNVIKNKNISLILGVSYLLYPAMQYANLYDFHAVTLATTFLLAAFYFLLKNKYIWLTIFLVLSGIAKEQVWLIVSLFGFYGFVAANKDTPYPRSILARQILFLTLFFASILLFYYFIWHAIPNASGSQHFALSYFSDFGDTPTAIIKNFLFSPQKIITIMLTQGPLSYLKQILFPLGLLSLFAPVLLIFALPDLFINLLSNNSQLHQIYYQYSATITPFIFISAIFGIKNLKNWLASLSRSGFPKIPDYAFVLYLTLTTLYCSYAFGPLPWSKNPNIDMFARPQKNKLVIENFLSNIPERYSVSATNNLGSHLSHRQKISTVPENIAQADIVLFLIGNSNSQSSKDEKKALEKLKIDKNYTKVFQKDNFIVFKKNKLQIVLE